MSNFREVLLISALFILLAIMYAGCTAPDQWTVFDNDNQQDQHDTAALVDVPEELQPRLAENPPSLLFPGENLMDLSVEQAVMLVLQNNRDLRVNQLNPVIAGTFEQIERGEYDPELFVEMTHGTESAIETSRSTGEQFEVESSDTGYVAGLRQELPSGTSVEFTVEQSRDDSNRAPEQQKARLGLSITQSLLRGFGPAVNLAAVRQAELDTLASIYELRGFVETLLAETETAYWNYVLANQEIAIFEQSLAVASQQRDEIEQRIEVGTLPEIEAAAARAEVALREQALINARSTLEDARLRLLRLINPHPQGYLDGKINAISDPNSVSNPVDDLEDRLLLARKLRPDLQEARLRLEQNTLETIMTKNGLLPKLDLFIALGKTGFADKFLDSFGELDGNTNDVVIGMRLSHLLRNRAAKARDLAARASRDQGVTAVDNLDQIVQLDVRLAMNELERTRQQISASKITRIYQEQTLNAEKERFDVGSSTALLLAQAHRDLLASSIAEVRAIVNYRIALINMYLAEGSLLEHRGVSLPAVSQ